MSTAEGGAFRAVLRARPLFGDEAASNRFEVLGRERGGYFVNQRQLPGNHGKFVTRSFQSDGAHDEGASQMQVFEQAVLPLLPDVLRGYNTTVVVSGMRSGGKSFTAVGPDGLLSGLLNLAEADAVLHPGGDNTEQIEQSPYIGIVPRAIFALFSQLRETGNEFLVKLCALEVKGDQVNDLLASRARVSVVNTTTVGGANLHDDADASTCQETRKQLAVLPAVDSMVVGIEDVIISTPLQALRLVTEASSVEGRGSVIYIITVLMRNSRPHGILGGLSIANTAAEYEERVTIGRFIVADVAGADEEGNENKAALALNKCITGLSTNTSYVPFRDSKLTRILQGALMSSVVLFIYCIVPHVRLMDDILATSELLKRTRAIRLGFGAGVTPNMIVSYRWVLKGIAARVETLQRDLEAQRAKDGVWLSVDKFAALNASLSESEKKIEYLDKEHAILTRDLSDLLALAGDMRDSLARETGIRERAISYLERERQLRLEKEIESINTSVALHTAAERTKALVGEYKTIASTLGLQLKRIQAARQQDALNRKRLEERAHAYADSLTEGAKGTEDVGRVGKEALTALRNRIGEETDRIAKESDAFVSDLQRLMKETETHVADVCRQTVMRIEGILKAASEAVTAQHDARTDELATEEQTLAKTTDETVTHIRAELLNLCPAIERTQREANTQFGALRTQVDEHARGLAQLADDITAGIQAYDSCINDALDLTEQRVDAFMAAQEKMVVDFCARLAQRAKERLARHVLQTEGQMKELQDAQQRANTRFSRAMNDVHGAGAKLIEAGLVQQGETLGAQDRRTKDLNARLAGLNKAAMDELAQCTAAVHDAAARMTAGIASAQEQLQTAQRDLLAVLDRANDAVESYFTDGPDTLFSEMQGLIQDVCNDAKRVSGAGTVLLKAASELHGELTEHMNEGEDAFERAHAEIQDTLTQARDSAHEVVTPEAPQLDTSALALEMRKTKHLRRELERLYNIVTDEDIVEHMRHLRASLDPLAEEVELPVSPVETGIDAVGF